MDQANFLKGLVRVVSKDGTIWWTHPEHVASHAAIENWRVAESLGDGGYQKAYYSTKRA